MPAKLASSSSTIVHTFKMIVIMTLLAVIVALSSLLISQLINVGTNITVSPEATQPKNPVPIFKEADSTSLLHQHDDAASSSSASIYAAFTPPSTVADDFRDNQTNKNAVIPLSFPWPGPTFIIRSVSSGQVITLRDGQIMLTQPGGRGSSHWRCVENKGWLGFQNIVSGKFLGHDIYGKVRCESDFHQGWEYFSIRMMPDRGCVLLMTNWERLWPVGIVVEDDVEKLAKVGDGGVDVLVWEFIRV